MQPIIVIQRLNDYRAIVHGRLLPCERPLFHIGGEAAVTIHQANGEPFCTFRGPVFPIARPAVAIDDVAHQWALYPQ